MSQCGIIYYTDCRLVGTRYELIFKKAQDTIRASGLPIVSCSLKPLPYFGNNIVLEGRERSYPTMVEQILMALEKHHTKYVFFTEHDVLYHPTHWAFEPTRDDVYYYNVNNYRWLYPKNYFITYGAMTSLSSLCCNRELAIEHYRFRLKVIKEQELDKIKGREPRWVRKLGYEPGTKKRRRGGITNEEHVKRRSLLPNIDVRHKMTFSPPKVYLDDFIHKPEDFTVATMAEIPGWDIKGMFKEVL